MPSTELWIALILLARLGLTLHSVGSIRARSAAATAGRSLVEFAAVVVCAYSVGRIVHGAMGDVAGEWPRTAVQSIAWSVVPAGIVGTALAERTRIRAGVLLASLAVFAGWLANMLGGSIATHLTFAGPVPHGGITFLLAGAASAIVAARIAGARHRKYNRDGSTNFIPPHNVPMLLAGDLMLVASIGLTVGGIGATMSTLIASALAVLGAAASMTLRDRRIDIPTAGVCAVSGAVLGAVAGVDDLAVLGLSAAFGLALPWIIRKTDLKLKIDDPGMLAMPVVCAAIVGVAARALLDAGLSPGLWVGPIVIALASVTIGALFAGIPAYVLRVLGWLRVAPAIEADGLDLAEHDVNAYPDFQQTMIKSYHLRQ
jgi:Amt family ammonium transporter